MPSANSSAERRSGIAAVTFTSSSTARNLLALCEAAGVVLPATALRVSIGPITSETLRSLGYAPHAEAVTRLGCCAGAGGSRGYR